MTEQEHEIQRIKKEAVAEYIRGQHEREEAESLKEKKSPYKGGFIQMNKEAKGKMIWLMKHHKTAYCILNFLIFHMDKENTIIATYKVIQEALEISRPTAIEGIKILRDYNFIYIYKTGSSNIYTTNAEIAWTS